MTWELDKAHSEVGFAVKHMMIATVKGRFTDFDAKVNLDQEAIEKSNVSVTIDAASITTGEAQRDGHLKSPDFFDVEKYPKLSFESTAVKAKGNRIEVTGDLTIRDVTRPIALTGTFEGPAKDPWGNQRFGFELYGELERESYGLQWNQALEAGGVLVGKTVKIHVEGELVGSSK